MGDGALGLNLRKHMPSSDDVNPAEPCFEGRYAQRAKDALTGSLEGL